MNGHLLAFQEKNAHWSDLCSIFLTHTLPRSNPDNLISPRRGEILKSRIPVTKIVTYLPKAPESAPEEAEKFIAGV